MSKLLNKFRSMVVRHFDKNIGWYTKAEVLDILHKELSYQMSHGDSVFTNNETRWASSIDVMKMVIPAHHNLTHGGFTLTTQSLWAALNEWNSDHPDEWIDYRDMSHEQHLMLIKAAINFVNNNF